MLSWKAPVVYRHYWIIVFLIVLGQVNNNYVCS